MSRRLIVHVPGEPDAEYAIGERPLVVGRHPECDVCVPSRYVSRHHFRIEPTAGGVTLADLGGANPVLVNGRRVEGSIALRGADTIRVADVTIEYVEAPAAHEGTVFFALPPTEQLGPSSADAIERLTKGVWGSQHLGTGGTVSIMFTDIENSTPLVAALGDAAARNVIQAHNAVLREQFDAHRGYVAKRQGDGFLVLFASARDAVAAAVAVQRRLAEQNPGTEGVPVRVRIGIHLGEVLWDGDDIFGSAVNFAARVSAQAAGAEILVSAVLREVVAPTGEFAFPEMRELELKGFSGQHRLYSVAWQV